MGILTWKSRGCPRVQVCPRYGVRGHALRPNRACPWRQQLHLGTCRCTWCTPPNMYCRVCWFLFWSFAWNAAKLGISTQIAIFFKLPCVLKVHDHISEWKSDYVLPSFSHCLRWTLICHLWVCMCFPRQLLLYGGLDQQILVEYHEIQRDMSSVTNNYHSLFLYIDLFLYELKWNEQWVPVFVAVRWCTVEWWILIRGRSWRSAFSERGFSGSWAHFSLCQ